MNIKLSRVLDYIKIFQSIIDNEKDVQPLMKFKLLGYLKQLNPTMENFETIKNDLIIKYGKEDEEKGYSVNPEDKENWNDFLKEVESILDSEVDVDLPKFKAEEIMNAKIPSKYLMTIYDLIEE